MTDHIELFRDVMQAAGLVPPATIEPDKLLRFPGAGKRKGRDAWCKLFPDGGGGVYGDWSTGLSESWQARRDHPYTTAERATFKKHCDAAKAEREAEDAKAHADAASRAVVISEAAQPASENHPYAVKKHISVHGLKEHKGALVIPMRDADGALHSLQFIAPDGQKRFLTGGRVKGCLYIIGEPGATLCIAEGYATAASIHAATGQATAAAFDAGNLKPVALALRAKYPSTKITICGDADQSGVGQKAAQDAADTVGGVVALPTFTHGELAVDKPPSDFNDLVALRGIDAVAAALNSVIYAPASGPCVADEPGAGGTITGPQTEIPANDPGEGFEATVARLAALKPHEYDLLRTAESKRLKVRTATLDDAVKGLRAQQSGGAASLFTDVEPWHDPVDGASLLDEIAATVRRFIVCDPEIAEVAALWIAFTWLIDRFDIAPMILITAPEMRCGKTQLLNLIGKMVKRPLAASNVSPAVVYRVIEAHAPTLLIDEADSFFRENEELRGIVNSGHGRDSAYVLRTVGDNFDPKRFSTWGAKVLCGIGRLQATLMDRSLVLELRRKGPGETAAKLRHADPAIFAAIASKLCRFADDHGAEIGKARPNLPAALHDRAADNWEPMLAVADHAGGEWPERARSAALKMAGATAEADDLRGGLLQDIQAVFMATGQDRISTADLLAALIADDLKPYATWARGKPMTPRHLANKLADYRIAPRTIRIGNATPKGFLLSDFGETFRRYISPSPDTPLLSATPPQFAETLGLFDNLSATTLPNVADVKSPNPLETNDGCGVADRTPLPGEGTGFDAVTGTADTTAEFEL